MSNGAANINTFDTISAMRAFAIAGAAQSHVAVVHGHASAGDGGGGIFVWSTTPAIDDGKPGTSLYSGTIVNPLIGGVIDPSPAAGWRRMYDGALNVKWFGAKGLNTDDTDAIQSAYRAAARLVSATVYFPAGSYEITSTVTIGIGSAFTNINTVGDGAVATKLAWKGPTGGSRYENTMLLYWRNIIARMVGIGMVGPVTGETTGMLLSGPASGTQSHQLTFEGCDWQGFSVGLQAGGGARGEPEPAASELVFINCSFSRCGSGFLGQSSGNTINIWFYGCGFSHNMYGADLGSASSVHFWGGGSHGNTGATIKPAGGWQGTLRVEAFRFEIVPGERAISAFHEGQPTAAQVLLVVESCIFAGADATNPSWVPSYPVIGEAARASIRGCMFGNTGNAGWLTYDSGQSGGDRSLEMVGNTIHGNVPFFIHPGASGSDGLKYWLFGNGYGGKVNDAEVGRIVWPNRVGDVVNGRATFSGTGATQVVLGSKREDALYKVTISGDTNEAFWVTNKTETGFTLNSSDPHSTASVDWVVTRARS